MAQFFQNDAGEWSGMRLMGILLVITVCGVWTWANLCSDTYIPLGSSEAALLGTAIGGKALQSRFEIGSGSKYDYRGGDNGSRY